MTSRAPRLRTLLVVLTCTLATLVAASPASALDGAATAHVTVGDTLPEPNPFIPEDRNLSDCLSSIPKPGCGSEARGGPLQLATFGILMAGMAFIGWRVFRAVKRRDDAHTSS
jgi:hypothetical protein